MEDEKAFCLFIKILLKADHKTGTLITGKLKLSKLTGYPKSTVYKALKRLEREDMISIESHREKSIISIKNWTKWQTSGTTWEPLGNHLGNHPGNHDSIYKNDNNNHHGNHSGFENDHFGNTIQEGRRKNIISIPSKNEGDKPNKFHYDEADKDLCDLLYKRIKENFDFITKNPTSSDYATMNKIFRLDKKSRDVIKGIIIYSTQDEFWSKQIQSVSGLRKHFDKIQIQARAWQLKKQQENKPYVIPGSTKTNKNTLPKKDKLLTDEQVERGRLIKKIINNGTGKLSNIGSLSIEQLRKIAAE